jgi:translation initiation factor 3 subunit F
MMMSESLHLGGSDTTVVHVHPVVILSILDHFKRRGEDQDRVVGTLMGVRRGNEVEISSCFPVPHDTDNNQYVRLIMEVHETMLALQNKVNEHEVVVGWYTTGDKISYISSLLHDHYASLCREPVMLTVDTGLTNSSMSVKAFTSHTVLRDDEQVKSRYLALNPECDPNDNRVTAHFSQLRLTYHCHESERVGVDAMINSLADGHGLDAPATMRSHFDSLELSLSNLRNSIRTIQNYVQLVQKGEIKGDPVLGRQIANTLAQVPHITPDTFNENVQDLLMVMYLAKLTRTQAALTDKINFLL